MSLRFFFNRRGMVVLSLIWSGWIFSLYHLSTILSGGSARGPLTVGSYLFFLGLLFFRTIVRFVPWYRAEDRGHGIEEQFEKAMVPTAYIALLTNIIFYFWRDCLPFVLFSDLLMLVIVSVDFIMLYFHFKDHETRSPGYFSRSLYEQEK